MKKNYFDNDTSIILTPEALQEMLNVAMKNFLIEHNFMEKLPSEPRFLSLKQVCEELKVSKPTFINWRKGSLKSAIESITKKIGKRATYNIDELKRFMRNNPGAFSGEKLY